MRKGNKTKPEEIISILRSIEVLMSQGKNLELACREAQIAKQTYYRWRQEFGGMQVNASKVREKLSWSERKACKLLNFNRQTIRYKSKKRDDEDKLRADIICLASKYASFGYRRITKFLQDEGWRVNNKRVLRICNEEGLNVLKKQKKRYRTYTNDGSCTKIKALYPNHVWSYDFIQDRLSNGKKIRILILID